MAVGKPVPMLDARARVDGSLDYAANLNLPNMLTASVLRSPYPHARLLSIDASAAKNIPGVVAVLTAPDLRAICAQSHYGSARDQTVVATDRVRHVGEPVALVAANDISAAEAALLAIDVEYEQLPSVFDVMQAIEPEAPQLHEGAPGNVLNHARLRHGDLEAGFATAEYVVEETFTSPVAQQTSLEPQVAVAQWKDGLLTVWTSSQSPYFVRDQLAALFGLETQAVRVIVPAVGGGFGGKGNIRTQPMAAALAFQTGGRPVKLVLSRAEEFVTVTKHAALIHIKTGFKKDGTLTARQIELHWNAGAYSSSSKHLVPAGMLRAVGPYRIPAVHVDSYGVYTNLPQAAAYRGAMSSQTTWAHESHMDSIAKMLGIDPFSLRKKHMLQTGDHFATGEELGPSYYRECLEAAATGIGWESPLEQPRSGNLRRGRGMAVMMKHTIADSRSECRLLLDGSGRVSLYTSTVEMGQGSHTALAQIAAEELGLPISAINVIGPDTHLSPYDSQTASSRATFMMGRAVTVGSERMLQQIIQHAAALFDSSPDELTIRDGKVHSSDHRDLSLSFEDILRRAEIEKIEAIGEYETRGRLDPETGQGLSSPHWHQGAGACEVEVDRDSGQFSIIRYHSAAYAGKVINPNSARLQNDGNVIYGMGPALMEEMLFQDGQVINANLSDYLIPSTQDLPGELTTTLIEDQSGEIHGLGEMTLPPVAPAIANAIYDAVGVRIRNLPISGESVYRALQTRDESDE